MEKYILDNNKQVQKCNSLMEWAEWLENSENTVLKQDTAHGVFISTIFLGIDHNHTGKGDPVLFETMIEKDGNQEFTRYCTYDEAMQEHKKVKSSVLNK